MTCKECFHFKVCDSGRHIGEYIEDDGIYSEGVEKECIAFIPSADIVEVRHGRWIYHECVSSHDGCKSGYSCSICNAFVDEEVFDTDEFHKAFCGNCGAKMDGERREE